MRRDIDDALAEWPYDPEPGAIKAREVRGRDNRVLVQIRLELGLMQMESEGRPDGGKPHGFATFLDYLMHKAARDLKAEPDSVWAMTGEQCLETDREISQFYHRRVAWLSLQRYERALADADHALKIMDFVDRFGPGEEYKISHERYRGLVLFHRTQAAVALSLSQQKPELAIDAIRDGKERLSRHHKNWRSRVIEDDTPNEQLLEQLSVLEDEVRRNYSVAKTLREQLEEAVAAEDYEAAARIRDQMKERGETD